MRAAREETETGRRLIEHFRLRQDAATDGHHRIGREHIGVLDLVAAAHTLDRGFRLLAGEAHGERAGKLAAFRGLVDLDRLQRVRLEPGLIEESEPARGAGSEHQFRPADHRRVSLCPKVRRCGD
jgi:hypothetical protein